MRKLSGRGKGRDHDNDRGVVWGGANVCNTHEMAEGMDTSSTGASGMRDDIGVAMSERPTCILCLGMAGTGKTTFVQVEL